jgi:hypothetical protein
LSLHLANKISSGNRNPRGDGIEAEERAAAGRRLRPEAVTEQKAGYQTADAFWTKAAPSESLAQEVRQSARALCGRLQRCRRLATQARHQRTRAPLLLRSCRRTQSFRSEMRKRQYLPRCRPGISPNRAFILSVFGCMRRRAAASVTSSSGSKSITGARLGPEL